MTAIAVCRTCGTEPLENARFCHGCGSPVDDADTRAEYKQVTVLFADVVQSMDIAAAVGAERLREIMTELVDRATAVVHQIDQAGTGLNAVSKWTTYESLKTLCRNHRERRRPLAEVSSRLLLATLLMPWKARRRARFLQALTQQGGGGTTSGVTRIVDSDQHLYESRSLWADHIDPAARDDALSLVDDELGYTWLSWHGAHLGLADVHRPGNTASCGEHRNRQRAGEPASYRYDEALPAAYWQPASRLRWLDEAGLDEAILFPNFGLLWERRLSSSLPAMTANMAAWNRWCTVVRAEGGGRLHPVAHLTLRDPGWLEAELDTLAGAGITLAMIGTGPVDGREMSHPEHDRIWSAFVDHAVTPVFHVADQVRVFDDCWYQDDPAQDLVPATEAVFLWVPPALALSDLILHGVFDRHPRLRFGVVELSSAWVPQFLMMLDGASAFTTQLNGKPVANLSRRPSEYFLDHVRVSSFSYENPKRLAKMTGDVFMFCSDYPHSEGTATPLDDYRRMGCQEQEMPGLFHTNVDSLLNR